MANSKTTVAATEGTSPMAILVPAVGWFIPGAGHLMQKKWGRGSLILVSILTMYWLGLQMDGHVYGPNGGDILEILSFVGQVGAGALYIISRALELGSGVMQRAAAAYGTVFLVGAGLLNFIAVADAYHIAIGKKS